MLNSTFSNITDLNGIEPIIFDPTGSIIYVNISGVPNGVFYIVVKYENSLGFALSNVIKLEINRPIPNQAISSFPIYWIMH